MCAVFAHLYLFNKTQFNNTHFGYIFLLWKSNIRSFCSKDKRGTTLGNHEHFPRVVPLFGKLFDYTRKCICTFVTHGYIYIYIYTRTLKVKWKKSLLSYLKIFCLKDNSFENVKKIKRVFSLNSGKYPSTLPSCLVLVGYRNGSEREFTNELK